MAEVSLCLEDVQAIITGIATHPGVMALVAQLMGNVRTQSQENLQNAVHPNTTGNDTGSQQQQQPQHCPT